MTEPVEHFAARMDLEYSPECGPEQTEIERIMGAIRKSLDAASASQTDFGKKLAILAGQSIRIWPVNWYDEHLDFSKDDRSKVFNQARARRQQQTDARLAASVRPYTRTRGLHVNSI